MKQLMAWLAAGTMLIVAGRYSYEVYKRKISPTFSTWLILLSGTSLSLITYTVASNRDFQSGILNTIDVVVSFIIVLSIMIWEKNLKLSFKPFEKKYLLVAIGIIIFWAISKDAFVSNLLVQVLLTIGYLPTMQNLIKEKRNVESFIAWSLGLTAGFLALYPAIAGGNILATIYSLRTIVLIGIVLGLMSFYRKNAKKRSKK